MSLEVVLTKAAKTDVLQAAQWYQERSALAAQGRAAPPESVIPRVVESRN